MTQASASPDASLAWDPARLPPAQRLGWLACFAALYAAIVWSCPLVQPAGAVFPLVRPAAGLLLNALFFTRLRTWPVILAVPIAIETLWMAHEGLLSSAWAACVPLVDVAGPVATALMLRRLAVWVPAARLNQVLHYLAAAALGAAGAAALGAWIAVVAMGASSFAASWQVWWAADFLGSLVFAPVGASWLIWRIQPQHSTPLRSRLELLLIAAAALGLAAWIFSTPRGEAHSLLQLPLAVLAVLAVAAFRLPPRWASLLASGVVLLCAALAAAGLGPYVLSRGQLAELGSLQLFLGSLTVFTLLLSAVLLEQRSTVKRLRTSEERYRQFVEQSSEAVWRIELARPMPLGLPLDEQRAWLVRESQVAESNTRYRWLDRQGEAMDLVTGTQGVPPWLALFLQHLERASSSSYSVEDLRLEFRVDGRRVCYSSSFTGVVENGCLRRIWGIARDITELTELNRRLVREQERLRAYARQLIGAEERARRSTAVELHEGAGRLADAMGESLDELTAVVPAGLRARIEELQSRTRQIRELTRKVTANLSPPGLYDMGLGPALQWLAVQLRSKEGLAVVLDLQLREPALSLELRVLAYRLAHELLTNVVRYARVASCQVRARQTRDGLELEVVDRGVGFEWQLDLFQSADEGFGLWSVADRVRNAGGTLAVDTAPGRGCHIRIRLPLELAGATGRFAVRPAESRRA